MGNAHHGFYDPYSRQVADSAVNELAEELRLAGLDRTVIVSSEYLSFATPTLVEGFERVLGQDVRIIFYVRQQTDFVTSAFLQAVKVGREYRGSLDAYLETNHDSFDDMNRIQPWSEVFGNSSIVSHVYHRSVVGSNVTSHFLGILGMGNVDVPMDKLNPSPLPELFAAIKALDDGGIDRQLRESVVAKLLGASGALRSRSTLSLISPKHTSSSGPDMPSRTARLLSCTSLHMSSVF